MRAPSCCIASAGGQRYLRVQDRPLRGSGLMPTVLRVGPYRFFFYSGDGGEPPHIHVERDQYVAKVWLDPVRRAVAAFGRPSFAASRIL